VSQQSPDAVRQDLQRRRRTILETSRRAEAEIDSLRDAGRDPEVEEGAQWEHEQLTLARLSDAQRREVLRIDAALARIEAGGYGTCQDCGTEIDPRRLAALPYAVLCTECTTQRERAPGTREEEPPAT
jgi:DnaK suppressor protein